MRILRGAAGTIALVCVALAVGCGGETGPKLVKVGGTVKYKGAPVAGATVSMAFDNGQVASGVTDDKGVFNMTTGGRQGTPVGKAKVGITKMAGGSMEMPSAGPTPEDLQKMGEKMLAGGAGSGPPAGPKNELPEKYASGETSGLVADVTDAGVTDLLFELQD